MPSDTPFYRFTTSQHTIYVLKSAHLPSLYIFLPHRLSLSSRPASSNPVHTLHTPTHTQPPTLATTPPPTTPNIHTPKPLTIQPLRPIRPPPTCLPAYTPPHFPIPIRTPHTPQPTLTRTFNPHNSPPPHPLQQKLSKTPRSQPTPRFEQSRRRKNQRPTEKNTAWGGEKVVLDRRGLGRAGTCVSVKQSTRLGEGGEMV